MIPRIKAELGRDRKRPLHWAGIRNHDKRLFICRELLTESWEFSAVLADKQHPFIKKAAGLKEKWKFYFYSMRVLLERLSWYAREQGARQAHLILEKRTNVSYTAMEEYFKYLRGWIPPLQIDWGYIDKVTIP